METNIYWRIEQPLDITTDEVSNKEKCRELKYPWIKYEITLRSEEE